MKRLQGTWKMVAAGERGSESRVEVFDQFTFRVQGSTLQLIEADGLAEKFTLKIDSTQSPAHFDLTETGKTAPGTCHAIYKLEDERLTICFTRVFHPDEENERPTEFSTGPSDQRPPKGKVMLTFEKIKE